MSHKSIFTLTGNYNGDPNDDNIKPNGDIASGSTDLGESWLVPENNTMYVKLFHHMAFAEHTLRIKYPSACWLFHPVTFYIFQLPIRSRELNFHINY